MSEAFLQSASGESFDILKYLSSLELLDSDIYTASSGTTTFDLSYYNTYSEYLMAVVFESDYSNTEAGTSIWIIRGSSITFAFSWWWSYRYNNEYSDLDSAPEEDPYWYSDNVLAIRGNGAGALQKIMLYGVNL